jgi:hypothetical protein
MRADEKPVPLRQQLGICEWIFCEWIVLNTPTGRYDEVSKTNNSRSPEESMINGDTIDSRCLTYFENFLKSERLALNGPSPSTTLFQAAPAPVEGLPTRRPPR